MPVLLKFVQIVDAISERLGSLITLTVVATVAVGFYNVVARYLGRFIGMQLSSNTFIELQWYMYSVVFLLGFAYILKRGINVRVDFLYSKWPKERKAKIDFWGHLLFLVPFCMIGIWVSINPILASWGRLANGTWGPWEMSPDAGGLPRAPLKSMIIVGFALLALQALAELMKLYLIMRGRDHLLNIAKTDTEQPLRIE
ncbi:MAG: TRAP transporter small permease subunit [Caldilineaceae bacterium]|nr:TRAP transporter small permease subunit [Caldilineaceae bacterium]